MQSRLSCAAVLALLALLTPPSMAQVGVSSTINYGLYCYVGSYCEYIMTGTVNLCQDVSNNECISFNFVETSPSTPKFILNGPIYLAQNSTTYDNMVDVQIGWDQTRVDLYCNKACSTGACDLMCTYTCGGSASNVGIPKSVSGTFMTKEEILNGIVFNFED
ncbi:hypothetical protein K493DRAFT_362933 [Basidiobolus meristosporus CBS 931.73]|uniref:Uncharacterized protein n=1 Tax=Basidiobolus meristosporus CBS 931.73 TaxID=1314790 RepID=A0A1Y1WYP7_9FUNG|nr:hypothetical protein K493DRAFT_362933 [Basidiobolus meristosporus CBS 931.73]|eukprot:ORX78468.1 hypothetical protein K493DRAFT_362933 [Basidiobolus meristosporus CBS 931.73]